MSTASEPNIRARGTVRVSLPARIAYHPDALKQSLKSVLEKLGCPSCFSGADCHFQHERDFIIDPADKVTLNPQPLPPREASAVVSLAPSLRYDIDKVFKSIDAVIKGLGPCPCHSGIDVLYQSELPVLGITEHFEVQRFGR